MADIQHPSFIVPFHPPSFRERVLHEFRSPQNVQYVTNAAQRFKLPVGNDLAGRMYRFSTTYGQGGVMVDSDPLAQRGTSARGANLWAELKRMNIMPGEVTEHDESTFSSIVRAPEDFLVVAAGGRAGAFSAFIPGWSGKRNSESVSKEIRLP